MTPEPTGGGARVVVEPIEPTEVAVGAAGGRFDEPRTPSRVAVDRFEDA